jgi:hypothetical protein
VLRELGAGALGDRRFELLNDLLEVVDVQVQVGGDAYASS